MTWNKIRKLCFMFFAPCFFTLPANGQKTEVYLNTYSGLFSFRGNGTTATSWANSGQFTSPQKYTSNVYGKKSGFSYSIELQGQHVSKRKNIAGIALGFETLTSKVNIDTLTDEGIIYWKYPGHGYTTLQNTFLTLTPLVGHRYLYKKIVLDLLVATDLGFCLRSKEHGSAEANNKNYSLHFENNITKPTLDFRPRLQFKIQYERFGFLAGYSLGMTNYQTKNNAKAYSNFLRLGLSFQLK